MTKLKHGIKLPSGTVVPAGTNLTFSNEGVSFFKGERLSVYGIPTFAFEQDDSVAGTVDSDKHYKAFDAIEPGDQAIGKDGIAVTIVGKAIGAAGYDALYQEFGTCDGVTLEDLTAGMDEEDIKELQFVAYTNADGEICIDKYGADYIAALENAGDVVAFIDVQPADAGVDAEGKPVTILSKGTGKVWHDKTVMAMNLDSKFEVFEGLLDENESTDAIDFVLVKDAEGAMAIHAYNPADVQVFEQEAAEPKDDKVDPAVESIMLRAAKRWNAGGKHRYARMQAEAAVESICIKEEDEAIRENIVQELADAGVNYAEEDGGINIEDDDSNAETLAKLAVMYPSVATAMADAGIECVISIKRATKQRRK